MAFIHFHSLRMPRVFAYGALASILVLAACTAPPGGTSEGSASSSTTMMASSVSSVMHASSTPASQAAAHTVQVTVESFKFTPSVIRVKKGEKVTLALKGLSGTHGFMVEGLRINVPVDAGQAVDVTIPTDKAGTFVFRCSIPCGSGHADMRGQIVIE